MKIEHDEDMASDRECTYCDDSLSSKGYLKLNSYGDSRDVCDACLIKVLDNALIFKGA